MAKYVEGSIFQVVDGELVFIGYSPSSPAFGLGGGVQANDDPAQPPPGDEGGTPTAPGGPHGGGH